MISTLLLHIALILEDRLTQVYFRRLESDSGKEGEEVTFSYFVWLAIL